MSPLLFSRAREKDRQRPPHSPEDSSSLDKEYISDSELVTSPTRGTNGGDPLPRLGASPTPVKDGLELLLDGKFTINILSQWITQFP